MSCLPVESPRRNRPARPTLVRRDEAAAMLSIGVSTFDRYDVQGLLPAARMVSGSKLWSVAELKAWAAHGCPPRGEWSPIWAAVLAGRFAKK